MVAFWTGLSPCLADGHLLSVSPRGLSPVVVHGEGKRHNSLAPLVRPPSPWMRTTRVTLLNLHCPQKPYLQTRLHGVTASV